MSDQSGSSRSSTTPWNVCVTPGCAHNGCGPKVRAWGGYGRRYICGLPSCAHLDCAARVRADADGQSFGELYWGPVLPTSATSAAD